MVALVWSGAPAWQVQIDDQYITLGYAWTWLQDGALTWTTGERVEGYSNPLQLLLCVGAMLLGLDAAWVIKLSAVTSGVALILLADRHLPKDRRGDLILFSLVAWYPLVWWCFAGMETSLYTLLLCFGWLATLSGSWGSATVFGAAASLTRPEGALHLVVMLLVLGWHDRQTPATLARGLRAAAPTGAVLAVYHVLRVSWFGDLLPTPYLVKVAQAPAFWEQSGQWGVEMLSAAGIFIALLLCYAPRRPLVVLAPLLLQSAVELRADLDWMGHARLVLPGLVVTALLWAVAGQPRPLPGIRAALGFVAAVVFGLLDPPGVGRLHLELRDVDALLHPASALNTALDTPNQEDVEWVIRQAPEGAVVLTGDVGMVGNIPGVEVHDLNGLTDRTIARYNAHPTPELEAELRARYAEDARPRLVRLVDGAEIAGWMGAGLGLAATFHREGSVIRWYRTGERAPNPAVIRRRWAALYSRYPSQALLGWQRGLGLVAEGRVLEAARLALMLEQRWPGDGLLKKAANSIFFSAEAIGTTWSSRPLALDALAGLQLELRAPAPLTARIQWSCGGAERHEPVEELSRLPLVAPNCPDASAAQLHVTVGSGGVLSRSRLEVAIRPDSD